VNVGMFIASSRRAKEVGLGDVMVGAVAKVLEHSAKRTVNSAIMVATTNATMTLFSMLGDPGLFLNAS
jgi:hypothetical protein